MHNYKCVAILLFYSINPIKTSNMNRDICLCYNRENGLVSTKFCRCDDAIFITHDIKKRRTDSFSIPDKNLTIHIMSNFNNGENSYLYAQIEHNGQPLLDFDKRKIRILNHSSIVQFSVIAEDWATLLNKIAYACNHHVPDVCPSAAISYVDELYSILNNDSVEIQSTWVSDKKNWEGKLLTTLLVAIKLKDLLVWLINVNLEDEVLSEHILPLCSRFLKNLKEIGVISSRSYMESFTKTLKYVCDFMMDHGAGVEFLQYFLQTSPELPNQHIMTRKI